MDGVIYNPRIHPTATLHPLSQTAAPEQERKGLVSMRPTRPFPKDTMQTVQNARYLQSRKLR